MNWNKETARLKYNGESISSVSVNRGQDFFAVGCGAQVEIARLHPTNVLDSSTMQLKSSGRFTITDVAFCPMDDNLIAASATNGMVAVFDLTHAESRLVGRTKWDSIEAPRSINKVNWHPTDGNMLISAGMDGTVRLFDLRDKTRKGTLYNTKAEATRDVQINPFDATMFAAISENGVLSIWDQRNNDIPVSKINAHTLSGLSVAWNPRFRGIIATGSRDKSVKIWDLGHTASNSKGGSVISSKPLGLTSTANNEELANKLGYRPVQVILTPSSVGRIRWRKSDKFADQLATVSTGTDNQSGEILVWNVNNPNMPRCVLKAHGSEACSDFVWLDTPLSENENGADAHHGEDSSTFLDIYQHILSVGRGGSIMIQDLRNAYFPRSHISPSVTAISSQGHVAFQRGVVDRGDPLGLISNEDTRGAPVLFQDNAKAFGLSNFPVLLKRPEPSIDGKDFDGRKVAPDSVPTGVRERGSAAPLQSSSPISAIISLRGNTDSSSLSTTDEEESKNGTGQVYCGLAEISNLGEAQEIRGVRGAEGGVFDPAVIALLARTYKLGIGNGRDEARAACETNLNVALESGLQCRASVWSVVLSLLSKTPETAATSSLSQQGMGEGESMTGENNITGSTNNDSSSSNNNSNNIISIINNNNNNNNNNNSNNNNNINNNINNNTNNINDNKSGNSNEEINTEGSGSGGGGSSGGGFSNPEDSFIARESEYKDSSVHLPSRLPFSTEVLGYLLQELLDGGDCQHFVVLAEVLRCAGLLESACEASNITVLQRREAYLAYFDLLGRLKLFCSANDIIKISSEDYISKITRHGVVMYTACAKCGKELQEHGRSPWCAKCNRCAATCSLCQKPVLKMMHWCPVCGHGGHRACLDKWFATHDMCPTGCGHKCCQGRQETVLAENKDDVEPLSRMQRRARPRSLRNKN